MSNRRVRTCASSLLRIGSATLGLVWVFTAAIALLFGSLAASAAPTKPAVPELAPTRFVVGIEKPVKFDVLSLNNPNRVVISLPDVKMRLPVAPDDSATGLVKSFRGGISAPGQARIVIEVRAPVIVKRSEIQKTTNGPQLVLDLVPAVLEKPAQANSSKKLAAAQPPLPRPAMRPEELAARAYKPVIVIDPGHGGHDSGAVKNGIVEKNAVLAFSKVLRDKLEATGRYRVVMTRDKDVFISLDERREIAERNKAALFIAVHADYAGSHARGATIYTLRESTAAALQRSAKSEVVKAVLTSKELSAAEQFGGDTSAVKAILADLAEREVAVTKERTDVFARQVIEFMSASTPMQRNADREANFRVLKTAKVPSVLIELAYVTNPLDARNLKSEHWRDKVADSIVTAIENYFSYQIARLPM